MTLCTEAAGSYKGAMARQGLRRWVRVAVGSLLAAVIGQAPLAVTQATAQDDNERAEWAGTWVVHERLEYTHIGLELRNLDTDFETFEAELPDWAYRLRGMCDPTGRFYEGAIADDWDSLNADVPVVACDASPEARSQFSEAWQLLGASQQTYTGGGETSLFGVSPGGSGATTDVATDVHLWGGSIQESNMVRDVDWAGSCEAGPCLSGTAPATTAPPDGGDDGGGNIIFVVGILAAVITAAAILVRNRSRRPRREEADGGEVIVQLSDDHLIVTATEPARLTATAWQVDASGGLQRADIHSRSRLPPTPG